MHQAFESGKEDCGMTIAGLCRRVGMSRQNYYTRRRERCEELLDAELMIRLIKRERRDQPRLGGRKLLHMIKMELATNGVSIGRDRFFKILSENGLLVERKRGQVKTTQSRHSLPVFRNLVAEMEAIAPNQIWVSDLTYIRTEEGYMFAAVIMDRHSRKIIGYHIGDSLEAAGCLEALEMALKDLPSDHHPIHHSDRGCQYCCHVYVERLQGRGLPISMTEIMHCYENAAAERVIGILKQEYELDRTFRTKKQALLAFNQGVYLYNYRRPHLSLNYRIPAEVHAKAA
jgi:putative transposase